MTRNLKTFVTAVSAILLMQSALHAQTLEQAPDGRNIASLAQDWWRWAETYYEQENDPVADIDGSFCDVGQKGDIWFLSGSYGEQPVRRPCVIPAGKHIFFPVVNYLMSDTVPDTDCTDLQAETREFINAVSTMEVRLDGKAFDQKQLIRPSEIGCFKVPNSINLNATDGYFLLLPPLEKGKHQLTIKVSGRTGQDVSYQLVVE